MLQRSAPHTRTLALVRGGFEGQKRLNHVHDIRWESHRQVRRFLLLFSLAISNAHFNEGYTNRSTVVINPFRVRPQTAIRVERPISPSKSSATMKRAMGMTTNQRQP